MKPLFKQNLISSLKVILIVLIIVKIVWVVAQKIFLPSVGVEHIQKIGGNSLYYRVRLTPNKAPAPRVVKQVVKPVIISSIRDIILIAIYNSDNDSVVTLIFKGKTKVLGRGDVINGFVLEGATNKYAIFSKGGKNYKLFLKTSSKGNKSFKVNTPTYIPPTPVVKKNENDGVINVGDRRLVSKSLVEHYSKNLKEVYKNIGIAEIKDKTGFKGFRISFIRKGSVFDQLGVMRGDIIKTVNGIKIDSYQSAFAVYKKVGDITNLTMVVERNNQEVELEYEVN